MGHHSGPKLKEAPGYDFITGRLLKELSEDGITYFLYLFNATLRLNFFPPQWKVAQVVIKPGKNPEDPKSYRPISLLPIISKVMERLILSRLMAIINMKGLIPNHQFGFRCKHSIIDQIHRIVNKISRSFEERKYCSAIFLDVSQAFDRIWHEDFLAKIKDALPYNLYSTLNHT